MPLAPRTRLGPYEIVAAVAEGGMGEVYRARDTRLDRTVAIKVLHADLATNASLRQRFEREARAVSSLSHPHVCALYDVGSHDGVDFLVMEFVEGETLAERLKRGAMPLDQALRTAIEILAALDAAHRRGVVHRDLKPGNVMLTKAGSKLLDFGLARLDGGVLGGRPADDSALTEEGTLLGTLQYMAPEQMHGLEADARSDLFAFGAVLYEMLTGQRAFQGSTRASLIAAIVGSEPRALRDLQPLTPPALERVVRLCLAKEPDDRWQNARDVMHELQWIATAPAQADAAPAARRGRLAWFVAAALGVLALAATAAWWAERAPRPAHSVHLAVARPVDRPFDYFDSAVVSPDGLQIAFVGYGVDLTQRLWVRPLDSDSPRLLDGTEGAQQPFWSPDSRSLGFFAGGKLKRIDVRGGPALVLCPAGFPAGGTWNAAGTILFAGASDLDALHRVPDTGGTSVAVTRLSPKEEAHRWPSFLPDGRRFVFLGDADTTEEHHLKLGSLDSPDSVDLAQVISNVRYVEPGLVLFVRGGKLLAQRLDPDAPRLVGEPVTVAEHVVRCGYNHGFDFSASANGVLTVRSADDRTRLTWIDRAQHRTPISAQPERFGVVSLAPDARHVVCEKLDVDGREADLWTLDLERGTVSRLTSDPASDLVPVWSTVGDRIAFSSFRSGFGDVFLTRASGPIDQQALVTGPTIEIAGCWSPDGRVLFYEVDSIDKQGDIWAVPVDELTAAHAIIATTADETDPRLSPDGKWLAYISDESTRDEVYVQEYPSGRRWQISTGGASSPYWSHDGSELFYVSNAANVMAVGVTGGVEPEMGAPEELFSIRSGNLWGVAPDGRFLVSTPVEDPIDAPLTVVLDWTAALDVR